ncbi:MAG: hypothetical protein JNM83_28465 [Myxococcales bacterium]|nr:hypothetical protein [Myxococcales bacterium]
MPAFFHRALVLLLVLLPIEVWAEQVTSSSARSSSLVGEAETLEPAPPGWETNGPMHGRELVVPPHRVIPTEEPMPAGWPPSFTVTELAERSTQFFVQKQFLQSADQLELAYAIDPQPLFLFNAGQAYRLADQPQKAIARYQRFLVLAPSHRLSPEAKGYIADMRILIAEQERTEMAQRLLEAEQVRARQERELLSLRALRAEEEKRVLAEQLRKSNRPLYKRPWFWGIIGGAVAVTATAIGIGVYFAKTPQVDGGFIDVRF